MRNQIVKIAFLSALLIVAKEALFFIPNVEVVTLLLMAYTYTLGSRTTIYITIIFTLVQSIIYPPHMWIITYFLIWPLLVIMTSVLKRYNANLLMLSIFASLFGFGFGAFDSLVNSFVYGLNTFIPLWIRGLPFDIIHAISNYLTVLILFNPIKNSLSKMISK